MTAYRDDVAALAARHEALTSALADKTREVADAAQLLDEARVRASRPVLDNIRVASPCHADWDQMVGDERVRACASCQKNVYNLSDMTRDEAEALIVEKAGKLCIRYYQRKDGTILLKDCSIGVSRTRKRRLLAAGAATLLAGAGLFAARDFLGLGASAPAHTPCDLDEAPIVRMGDSYVPPVEEAQAVEPEEEAVIIKGQMIATDPSMLPAGLDAQLQAERKLPAKHGKPATPKRRPAAK